MARSRSASKSKNESGTAERRRLIAFDDATYAALDLLARDSMSTIQELADEAFRDLLKKHGRPTDLKTALRKSAAESGAAPTQKPRRKR